MSLPPATQAALNQVAFAIRETFSERGHHVDEALATDVSFVDDGNSESSLIRTLVKDGARRGAYEAQVKFDTVAGGAAIITIQEGYTIRHFRFRKGTWLADGRLHIVASSDGILRFDGDSFFLEEAWVFAYTLTEGGHLGQLLVAPVLRYVEGKPGYLQLGSLQALDPAPLSGGFEPSNEDLDDFGEDGWRETGS